MPYTPIQQLRHFRAVQKGEFRKFAALFRHSADMLDAKKSEDLTDAEYRELSLLREAVRRLLVQHRLIRLNEKLTLKLGRLQKRLERSTKKLAQKRVDRARLSGD
jgi:hypothetical protein